MKLPEITYRGVQSLGRYDIQAPLREAAAKGRARMTRANTVTVLADTAVSFEKEYTSHQVKTAGFDFDSDRKEIMEKYLGRDTFSRRDLEIIGVDIADDDPRLTIPAYEVLPEIMRVKNAEALDRRAGKIRNSQARGEFSSRQSAALADENLKYQLEARGQMAEFNKKQDKIRLDEARQKGRFGIALDIVDQSGFDANEKRAMRFKTHLQQELYFYDDSMARLDVPAMKDAFAELTSTAEDYKGYLPSRQRKAYADELRSRIAQAEGKTTAKREAEYNALKTDVSNALKLSKEDTPLSAEQMTALEKRVIEVGDPVLGGKLQVLRGTEASIGPFRYQPPQERAIWLDAIGSQFESLSPKQKVEAMQRREVHGRLREAFLSDPFGANAKLGGDMPLALGMKGQDGKKIPNEDILRSWKALGEHIHAAQGMPGDEVQLIPKSQEQALVKIFTDGDFTSRKEMIRSISGAYGADGQAHKRLWSQLKLVKNGAVYGAAGELYARDDEANGDAMLQGLQAMEDKLVSAEKMKTAEILVQSNIGKAYWHDPESLAAYTQAARALAIGLAGAEGDFDQPETYIDDAVDRLAQSIKYRGAYLIKPSTASSGRGVRAWLDDMTIDDLSLYGGVAGDPEIFLSGLHNGSYALKTIGDGKFVSQTRTGNFVQNLFGEPFVLDYSKRREPGTPTEGLLDRGFGGAL